MKAFTKILTLALTALGFTSCGGLVMYGQPTAEFKLITTVVDRATTTPIKGLRVIITQSDIPPLTTDTLFTNDKGVINFSADVGFAADRTYKLRVDDVDEAENGRYASGSAEVKVAKGDFKGASGIWYDGVATKVAVVELDAKVE